RTTGLYSSLAGGQHNRVSGAYSFTVGYADTVMSEYSYLFGIDSDLDEDSTFMVDMPHIRFGDATDGYDFPTEDGMGGQVMATDGSGQLDWTTVSGGGGGGWIDDGDVVRLETVNDSVGIGTAAPSEKLEVDGNLRVTGKANIGPGNTNTGTEAFVIGSGNTASGNWSTVSGGISNTAGNNYGAIGGGQDNSTGGYWNSITGGHKNRTAGMGSSIAGGKENRAGGDYSFTVGYGDTIGGAADYSVLFGIDSDLDEDSTFMVDMPHIRFGDMTDGYEFPEEDGTTDQVLATDGSGQLGWATVSGSGGGDITAVTADNGLTGGGTTGDVTLYIDSNWVDAFVDTCDARYAASAGTATSATMAVTAGYADSTDAITDGGVDFTDIGQNGASTDQVIKWNGSAWTAAEDETADGNGWIDDGTIVHLDTSTDKVGVGTSSEAWPVKLEVVGGTYAQTGLWADWAILGAAPSYTYYDSYLDIHGTVNPVRLRGGNSESGTTSNQILFSYSNVVTYTHAIKSRHKSTGDARNAIDFYLWDYGTDANTDIGTKHVMTIDGGGNGRVGINTTDPSEELDVVGNIKMVDGNEADGYVLTSDANGVGTWQAANASSRWASVDSVLYTDNYLGIARGGADNALYGDYACGHINFGRACTTGVSGGNYGYPTVSGGYGNAARRLGSCVGGGRYNRADEEHATVGGGESNDATDNHSTVAGGSNNTASGSCSIIGGGYQNEATNYASTVGGGSQNKAIDWYSTIAGGWYNTAYLQGSTVGGGEKNHARGKGSFVGGGQWDTAFALYCGVASGRYNVAGNEDNDTAAFVGGGYNNKALGDFSIVAGGHDNYAYARHSAIVGGREDTTDGLYSFIGGGWRNFAGNYTPSCTAAVVGGGMDNRAGGTFAAIAGGRENTATTYAFVGGGFQNNAGQALSSVVGGENNSIILDHSVISGGKDNTIQSSMSSIPGGSSNFIYPPAAYSMAFGNSVALNSAYRVGLFDAANSGRVGINRDSFDTDGLGTGILFPLQVGTNGGANGNGAYLSFGGTWTNVSTRDAKEDFQPLDGEEVLTKIAAMAIESWQYKNTDEKHIGPVAEDFVAAFDVGTILEDGTRNDKSLAQSDVAGVALLAVKELYKQNQQQQLEIEELKALVNRLLAERQ
ncbi:tail fiber domain-containing protein, partial [Candidatus Zixiibacteriota bacterium]